MVESVTQLARYASPRFTVRLLKGKVRLLSGTVCFLNDTICFLQGTLRFSHGTVGFMNDTFRLLLGTIGFLHDILFDEWFAERHVNQVGSVFFCNFITPST